MLCGCGVRCRAKAEGFANRNRQACRGAAHVRVKATGEWAELDRRHQLLACCISLTALSLTHSLCSLSPRSWICNRDDKGIDVFNDERGGEARAVRLMISAQLDPLRILAARSSLTAASVCPLHLFRFRPPPLIIMLRPHPAQHRERARAAQEQQGQWEQKSAAAAQLSRTLISRLTPLDPMLSLLSDAFCSTTTSSTSW